MECKQKSELSTNLLTRIFAMVICGFLLFFHPAIARTLASKNFTELEPVDLPVLGKSKSENFEHVFIEKPSISNVAKSKSFIIKSGVSSGFGFSPQSQNWRWYDDEESRTPDVALGGENITPIDISDGNIIKLRFTLKEIAGVTGKNVKFKLQFSTFSDFSDDVHDVREIEDCAPDSIWCYANGAGIDNNTIRDKVLSDSKRCEREHGDGCGIHNESGVTKSSFKHKKNTAVEYEFTIKSSGAEENRTYFFRAYNVGDEREVSHALAGSWPSVVTGGARLIFAVQGLAASTPTEGVVTDVATTPSQVSFGFVLFNQEIEAAQRLIVTTNARRGYRIFVLERQGLKAGNAEIFPSPGINEEPFEWFLSPDATSVYGYHAGDDTLSVGSTRFAPNNSYAHFEAAPKEIGFNSGPVIKELTDIIFKIQVTEEQEAGEYAGAIAYIVVPTF